MLPLRVAPGKPAKGVKPILVHKEGGFPSRVSYPSNKSRSRRENVHILRSIQRFPISNRTGRRTTPKMQGDYTCLFLALTQERRHRSKDECIADPVKPKFPQLVLGRHLGIDGICSNVRGHGLVKGRVETGDVLALGQMLETAVDDG